MTTTTDPIVLCDKNHVYTVDSTRVPGVSEILSSVAVKRDGRWCSLARDEFMQRWENNRQFGSAMHEYIRLRLLGQEVEYDQEMGPWVAGWERFRSDHMSMETILYRNRPLVEAPLFCSSLGYCGTPDAAVVYRDQAVVLDWKTGALNDVYRVKMAAYVKLLSENANRRHWYVWLVEIKQGTYHLEILRPGEVEPWVNKWVSIVNVYRLGGG